MTISLGTHEKPLVRGLPIGVQNPSEYGDCRPQIHLPMPVG
ncbi:hypothetical protein RISK_004320 [Rhodopirellula islandica]|uniref:Uncharacterized protein n=1 Tax=Rhodopirellula islandica TaxID=595434 RepID=A0A0J1BBK6_RHOIS|nr:hypothetical protein RISK_004320 [Rhodopirellula islandica]